MKKKIQVDDLWQEVTLMKREWTDLLASTAKAKIDDWLQTLPMHSILIQRSQTMRVTILQIAARGNLARLKLGRILVRLSASILNKNMTAFEMAFKDLIELGRSV